MTKKRVLSGIRATGRLHLGNYLGAVKGMLALQNNPSYETLYMVADLHSINTPYDTKSFQDSVRGVVLDYLSAGLDPEKSIIFVQSHVPEHVELSYLFSTVLTVARMLHLPTYKDKLKENSENANMAMLYYPVLMASDILIYEKYDTDFPEPGQFKTEGHHVPSLTGEGKMSKSVEGSYINLTDNLETIKDKLARVPTDTGCGTSVPEEGGVAALLTFVELFQGSNKRKEYENLYLGDGVKYSELKENLAELIFKEIEPIQKRRRELESKPEYVDKVIKEGAGKATKIASETLREVKQKMGFI
ncbi:MAG: Tryptophan-tRNA ligase [Candidatus Woesebacteria bacterium GW2011_GWB1_39_12]|uniref:tryptophan--tRNA ligase n=1 Tax=Candidatus Woesebacteria bacterium GW2011_GWB1_39_12 TaxID=1618574 RepID=A0A0G0PQ49_9BACT|nr:MAG: Tryptophan-tRNA ligase [Candidatus Woesebacteria bacterium GW2011_GWB1_39_12]